MFNFLIRYVEALTVVNYRKHRLRLLYEFFIARTGNFIPVEPSQAKQLQDAHDKYLPLSILKNQCSCRWDKQPYDVTNPLLDIRATERLAENAAAQLVPQLIKVFQRYATPLTQVAMELFLTELQTSARSEDKFEDFLEHVQVELLIFESSDLNMELTQALLEIRPWRSPYYEEREFYEGLGLKSPQDAERYHTFVFRKIFFQELSDAISNFDLDKVDGISNLDLDKFDGNGSV